MPSGKSVKRLLLLLAFPALPLLLAAQQTPLIILQSAAKTIQVGHPFKVELEVQHDPAEVVVFPDSAKGFAPFEVYTRRPVETRTENGVSTDLCYYELMTWELDPVQRLSLSVGLVRDGDTTWVKSKEISFTFNPVIKEFADTMKVRAIPGVVEVPEPPNYRAAAILIMLGAIVVLSVLLLGRKPFWRWIRTMKVRRDWRRVQARLQKVPSLLPDQEKYISELNHVWKQYADPKGRLGLLSLTTPELSEALAKVPEIRETDFPVLSRSSRNAEIILFAGIRVPENEIRGLFGSIEAIMRSIYESRLKEARN